MAGLQEYKCPCCGGAIAFDSKIQKMSVRTVILSSRWMHSKVMMQSCRMNRQMIWSGILPQAVNGRKVKQMVYARMCVNPVEARLLETANMAATSCPFCDNPIVMMGQFAGALKPDLVIPFKLDKKAAKEGLKKHLTGKTSSAKDFQGSESY